MKKLELKQKLTKILSLQVLFKMDMSFLTTTRGQLITIFVILALTCCVEEVLSSPRCVALCHRSEEDSLCKRCRFREPMRFGKRSDKNAFREPMRFGKRLEVDYGIDDNVSVNMSPILRLLLSKYQ